MFNMQQRACLLCAKDREKPVKDREIADLERQLRITSTDQQVCSSARLAVMMTTCNDNYDF